MRIDVEALIGLGRLSSDATVAELEQLQRLLDSISDLSLARDEIAGLLQILPAEQDDCFGLAWTVVHRIEASPVWPTEALDAARGYWGDVLRQRLAEGGLLS